MIFLGYSFGEGIYILNTTEAVCFYWIFAALGIQCSSLCILAWIYPYIDAVTLPEGITVSVVEHDAVFWVEVREGEVQRFREGDGEGGGEFVDDGQRCACGFERCEVGFPLFNCCVGIVYD